uniref:Integrin subunit alpha 6 n=1 Tax=Petromyzon marinus TaxID=7757 RepID=S4RR32_PETMA
MLVGAPQAEGLPRQAARRSGGIYACPITQQPGDCSRLTFDDHVDPKEESKENQWMGVTVRSQGPGGKVLACAHRYERRKFVGNSEEIRSPVGRCYVLGQALGLDQDDHSEGGGWHACSDRGESYALYGFCQQGTAAGFTRDYHYLYFGSPGAHYWRGATHLECHSSALVPHKLQEVGSAQRLGEQVGADAVVHVQHNSTFRFSVDVANNVARRGEPSVVAGAPRAAHMGAVLLLAVNYSHNSLVPEVMLRGEGLASAYGYAVCLADLNGDGWMDLLVGAPYFFDQSKKSVGGAVYVYLNDNDGGGERKKRVRLEGTAGSGFGLTIAAIGDVDLDGFQDVAVGAPFEESGRVYIYSGGPSGVITKPAQVWHASQPGFGYSLSGGLDVDGNLYPDLLVGSLSDQVVLFRSRTVITADVHLLTDGDIDMSVKNCENRQSTCVRVLACFSYWARPPTYSPAITLHYSLNAEEDRRQQGLSSRVHLTAIAGTETGTLLGVHVLSGNVSLGGQGDTRCFNTTLRVHDHVKDKLRPIPLHLHYEVQEARWEKSEAAMGELLPTLNASVANPLRTEVNFVKEGCGEDKVCQSELSFNFSFCSHVKNTDTLSLCASEGGRPLFLVGQHKGLALNVSLRNMGDDAHETHLLLALPSGLSYRGYRQIWGSSQDVQPLCLLSSNASVVDCELGNPLRRGHQVLLYLILSTEGVTKDMLELSSTLQLTTTSEQEGLEPVIAKVKVLLEMDIVIISTVRPSQAYFGGEIRGESVIWWEGAAGSLVEFNITVLNLGHSLEGLGGAYVDIHFPVEMSNGKWLLYLVALELSGAE